MNEQNSAKGQAFTLMVFGGLVALCSVFFILGMVVGRGQSVPAADDTEELVAAAEPRIEGAEPELDFYEAVTEDDVPELAPPEPASPPAATEPEAVVPEEVAAIEPVAEADPNPAPGPIVLQLGAFRAEQTAQGVAADVREQGFSAFVSRPAGTSEFFRVQVGPFTSGAEADRVQDQLESQGFEVIPVR